MCAAQQARHQELKIKSNYLAKAIEVKLSAETAKVAVLEVLYDRKRSMPLVEYRHCTYEYAVKQTRQSRIETRLESYLPEEAQSLQTFRRSKH